MNDKPFKIQMFGCLSIVGALLIFIWLLTFKDPDLLYDLVTVSFFIIGGISLASIMSGVKIEPFKLDNFLMTIMSTAMNVAVLMYVNQILPLKIEFVTVDPQLYGVLIGVAEECFFRVFLLGFAFKMTGSWFIAIVASSAIWSTYHVARYGGNPAILSIIFICGCVLGATYLFTKSADGCIFGHGLWNYIALG